MKRFAEVVVENSLYTNQITKDAFLNDEKKIIDGFFYCFVGWVSILAAAKNKTKAMLYFKSDKQLRVTTIDDDNNDTSLIVKIMYDKGFFTSPNTANEITKFLVKAKAGQITDVDGDIIRGWINNIKPAALAKGSANVRKLVKDFTDGGSFNDLASQLKILAFRSRFFKTTEFMTDSKGIKIPKGNAGVSTGAAAVTTTAPATPSTDSTTATPSTDTTTATPLPAKKAQPKVTAGKKQKFPGNNELTAELIGGLTADQLESKYDIGKIALNKFVIDYFKSISKTEHAVEPTRQLVNYLSKRASDLDQRTLRNMIFGGGKGRSVSSYRRTTNFNFAVKVGAHRIGDLEPSSTNNDDRDTVIANMVTHLAALESLSEFQKNLNETVKIFNEFSLFKSKVLVETVSSWDGPVTIAKKIVKFLIAANVHSGTVDFIKTMEEAKFVVKGNNEVRFTPKFEKDLDLAAATGLREYLVTKYNIKKGNNIDKVLSSIGLGSDGNIANIDADLAEKMMENLDPSESKELWDLVQKLPSFSNGPFRSIRFMPSSSPSPSKYPNLNKLYDILINKVNLDDYKSTMDLISSAQHSTGMLTSAFLSKRIATKILTHFMNRSLVQQGENDSDISGWVVWNLRGSVKAANDPKVTALFADVYTKNFEEYIKIATSDEEAANFVGNYISGWNRPNVKAFLGTYRLNFDSDVKQFLSLDHLDRIDTVLLDAQIKQSDNPVYGGKRGVFITNTPLRKREQLSADNKAKFDQIIGKLPWNTAKEHYTAEDIKQFTKEQALNYWKDASETDLRMMYRMDNINKTSAAYEKIEEFLPELNGVLMEAGFKHKSFLACTTNSTKLDPIKYKKYIDIVLDGLTANSYERDWDDLSFAIAEMGRIDSDEDKKLSENQITFIEQTLKNVDENLRKKSSSYKEYMTHIIPMFEKYIDHNEKAAEQIFISTSPRMKMRLAQSYLANKEFSVQAEQALISPNQPIRPRTALTKKRIREILKYNNVKSENLTIPQSAVKNFKALDTYANKQIKGMKAFEDLKVTEVTDYNKKVLAQLSATLHRRRRSNKHGEQSLLVRKVFDVAIPAQVAAQKDWIDANPSQEIINPMFHGTGSIAASMILRYGFRVLKSGDSSVVGRMLGDGVYGAINIDKSQQYIGDNGYGRSIGEVGYIFRMNAALGEKDKDYKVMGLGNDYIRSPEWCVFTPNAQFKIYRAYEVQTIAAGTMRNILNENPTDISEEALEKMGFKDFVATTNLESEQNTYTCFTFVNGLIPQADGSMVDFEEFKPNKADCWLEPSAYGPTLVCRNMGAESGDFIFSGPSEFMVRRPELYQLYLDFIKE